MNAAEFVVVGNKERGEEITRRRVRLGINSINELAQLSGVSRGAVTRAQAGTASENVYRRLEAWLDDREAERADAESGAVASATRASWDLDVQVVADLVAARLQALEGGARLEARRKLIEWATGARDI